MKQELGRETPPSTRLALRAGLFVLFLFCSLAVFLFGANYYKLFPTNGNGIYAGVLSAMFLIAALLFKRSVRFTQYWQIAYAFFIASTVNLISTLFAGYNIAILQLFGAGVGTNQEAGLAKLYDALLVIIPILVLTRLSGADLGSLLLTKGNLNRSWGLGIGALVMVNYFTSVLIFYGTGYEMSKLGSAILWGVVFSLSNSLLEELWVRGLFLKKLVPLIGATGTVLVTSIWFGALHFLSVAYLPAVVVPIFVINTFTLGLACSILTLKTEQHLGRLSGPCRGRSVHVHRHTGRALNEKMISYNQLTRIGRLRRIRQLARTALEKFGLADASIKLQRHAGNTLFRIYTPKLRLPQAATDLFEEDQYLLRIHDPNYQTTDAIELELAWLTAMRRDADLPVPEPVPCQDGRLLVTGRYARNGSTS